MRPLAAQVAVLQGGVNARRTAGGASSVPVGPVAAFWRLILGAAAIAARAAAAATGAVADPDPCPTPDSDLEPILVERRSHINTTFVAWTQNAI